MLRRRTKARTTLDWLDSATEAARRRLDGIKTRLANYRDSDDLLPWSLLWEARKDAEIELAHCQHWKDQADD
jgi:hypothetical protein